MAENGKLSFVEKVALARAEAAAKASSKGNAPAASAKTSDSSSIAKSQGQIDLFASNSKKFYFNSSIPSTRLLLPGKKIDFVNHFFITDNEENAEYIRKNYCNKESGSVKITEVSEMFYQSSTMIQPEILPLPADMTAESADADAVLRAKQQELDAS